MAAKDKEEARKEMRKAMERMLDAMDVLVLAMRALERSDDFNPARTRKVVYPKVKK